ncbi:MAG: hypothetical protein HQM08_11160 [Candidatus Riflebacteria bacterium]|nr:hypothetical protein [Candidatus Riflebacteria bacterium]
MKKRIWIGTCNPALKGIYYSQLHAKKLPTNMRKYLLFSIFLLFSISNVFAVTNFYRENRNGKVFILQVDPTTTTETVFNQNRQTVFACSGAKRVAALPTAGWGDYMANKKPNGDPLQTGEIAGDPNGLLTLRPKITSSGIEYQIYQGPSTILPGSIIDKRRTILPTNYDIAVSQYMGKNKNVIRLYLFCSDFINKGPAVFRLVYDNGVASSTGGYRFLNTPNDSVAGYVSQTKNWGPDYITEAGDITTCQGINVNSTSDLTDLIMYHSTRTYSLQHVWEPKPENGNSWGINYLMESNKVFKANTVNPLATSKSNMHQIFDVAVDLGNANVNTLLYFRSYYNIGCTFVALNVNTNTSLYHIYDDVHDSAGQLVQIRDGSPSGSVLETTKVNPNPTILGHGAVGLYGLSCQNALSGTQLVVYEPIYKLNPGAMSMGEFTDNNRNNVPDNVDNDGLGYWGYRANHLIDRSNGSTIDSDYVLDYVIAHRFPLSGKTANNEFIYTEYAIERDPSASPSKLIPGDDIHLRVGNIYHVNPDVYGEYNQFAWDGNPGNAIFIWVGSSGKGYNTQDDPTRRNSGKILGVTIEDTSYATADYFGVVGTDDWAAGQGDLYFLARQYGSYVSPRVVAANNPYSPPYNGYDLWWQFQYDRSTYYGISRTYWINASPFTEWLNTNGFFIGKSVYSQMVYNVNCGCRGQRYDNYQLVSEASSPILDFSIVNIGAPPYVTGVIFPTIKANTGAPIVQPNTPVLFTGNATGSLNLLATGTVKYQYVVLDNAFDDSSPNTNPAVATNSGLIDSMNWSYTFTQELMKGRSVATFVVYLGIQYQYRDYEKIGYPYYSWWDVPMNTAFAWSNSKGGIYNDGDPHGALPNLYGAPLQITVGNVKGLSPTHPLVITSVDAQTAKGVLPTRTFNGIYTHYPKIKQFSSVLSNPSKEKVKFRIKGSMQFLSEINPPLETNYQNYGGIMPFIDTKTGEDHTRFYMDTSGTQKDANKSGAVISAIDFQKDLNRITYQIFLKAKIFDKNSASVNPTLAYTPTSPNNTATNYMYDGANPTSMDGYHLIASGTFGSQGSSPYFGSLIEPSDQSNSSFLTVTPTASPASPLRIPNLRLFDFVFETPPIGLPAPLDLGFSDLRDKYEVRVAIKYPIGSWSRVTVKRQYNSSVVTDSYNAGYVQDCTERSTNGWADPTACFVSVADAVGPSVTGLSLPPVLTSGDKFPLSPVNLRMTDSNPHDYLVRKGQFPQIGFGYGIGKDTGIELNNQEPLLDFTDWQKDSLYLKTSDTNPRVDKSMEGKHFCAVSPVSLSSFTQVVSDFPNECWNIYEPPSQSLIPALTLCAPLYNPNGFISNWGVASGDSSFSSSDYSFSGLPVTDGSGNLASGTATGTMYVVDNDPPNMRVMFNDQVNQDIMIELSSGLKDDPSSTLAQRKIQIYDMKTNTKIFEALVATTTQTLAVASLTEVYDLETFKNSTIPGYSITTNQMASRIPFKIQADARFLIQGNGYENGNAGTVPVSFQNPTNNPDLSGTDGVNYVFHRGYENQSIKIWAQTFDSANNQVIIQIPIIIDPGNGNVTIRTMEESLKKTK